MRKQIIWLTSCILFFTISLAAQCPDRNVLRARIIYLSDSSNLSPKQKLAELSGYLDKMDGCPYRNDSTHALLVWRIASLYYLQADYLKAIQYGKRSVKIIADNYGKPSVNPKRLIVNYYWISVFYDSLNNAAEKIKALDSAIDIAVRLNSASDIACIRALFARAVYFFDIGDYHRCIDDATMCEKMGRLYAKSATEKKSSRMGTDYAESSLGWIVNALFLLKNYELAEEYLANKLDEYKRTGMKNYLALLYWSLAEVQIHKGNYEKAILFFNRALACDKEAGSDFGRKQTLNTIGGDIYFKHDHDDRMALFYYRKALQCINKDKSLDKVDSFESLSIFTNIADVYVAENRYDSAFAYFQLAFDQIKQGMNEKNMLQTPPADMVRYKKVDYLVGLLIDKADAFRKKYDMSGQGTDLSNALSIYKEADQLLYRIKAEQSDLKSKLFWRENSHALYEHAIDACYLQANITDAIYFFERSRAVLLSDQLIEQRWLAEADIMKQTQVNKKITQLERVLAGTDMHSNQYSEIGEELFAQHQELDRLQQAIKIRNPLYYQRFMDTGFIRMQDIRATVLKDHQGLVEIFSGDSAIYTLIITRTDSRITKTDKSAFDHFSRQYLTYLSKAALLNRNYRNFIGVSHNLYRLLFPDNFLPAGRIIISPDVCNFPFEALVTDTGSSSPIYFLNDHIVSYAYSARYLMNDFAVNDNNLDGTFLGISPVQYRAASSLPTLQGSDQSLDLIASYFRPARNLIGAQATKDNFLRQYSRYKIIQLYSHASDTSSRGEPVIYFVDSALYLSDLASENKPSTRLVVLSACKTGNGRSYRGEGVFSFNRGFASLGIPTSIINLWEVDDQSTYRLTEIFYKYVSRGDPVDIALQKAKLEFIAQAPKESRLPYYWAAAIVAGKPEVLADKRPESWTWLLVATVLIAGLSFFSWRQWSNGKNKILRGRN